MADLRHEWQFSAVVRNDEIYSVAACIRCGSIRAGRAALDGEGAFVDLRGDCAREPQAPRDEDPITRSAG